MKKGFTLMEILAVLLVIAVVASFAVPLVKSVRREVRYQRAKSAAVQLAEAVRSFYADTKGCLQVGSFKAEDLSPETIGNCPTGHTIMTGVPGSCIERQQPVLDLFACDYISIKTFSELPYSFVVKNPRDEDEIFVTGTELHESEADRKKFEVNRDMTITESDD